MQTGEQVYPKDLIDINDDFIELLRNGGIVHAPAGYTLTEEEATKNARNLLRDMPPIAVREKLAKCSERPKKGSDFEGLPISHFYIKNGRLTFGFPYDSEWTLYLDDIEEFLKVPKW